MRAIRHFRHADVAYGLALLLRQDVLRTPLGLRFTLSELAQDVGDIHIGYFKEEEIVGCLSLKDIGQGVIKMRQVAVSISYQRVGIGSQLADFAHKYAIEQGYHKICCHARVVAVPFYKRLSYHIVGEEFMEVGIPHRYMERDL